MRIYYAHSKRIYNQPAEKQQLEFLRNLYTRHKVICPNNDIGELRNIEGYLKVIESCDVLVCSEYDSHVGRGVYEETERAIQLGLPCYVLRENTSGFFISPIKDIEIEDSYDWKVRYGEVK